MTDRKEALAWAEKVAKSKPPRYTEASRNAAGAILADAEALKAADELAENASYLEGYDSLGDYDPAMVSLEREVVVDVINALAAYRKARGSR